MFKNLIISLLRYMIRKELRRAYGKGWDDGISKGYDLGWLMRKTEETNRGFILGGPSRVNREIEEILKEMGA